MLKLLIAAASVAVIAGTGLLFWQQNERTEAAATFRDAIASQAAMNARRDECHSYLGRQISEWATLKRQCVLEGHITDAEAWNAANAIHRPAG